MPPPSDGRRGRPAHGAPPRSDWSGEAHHNSRDESYFGERVDNRYGTSGQDHWDSYYPKSRF
eukprot:6847515-Ditylum_brightwellii.AAC.1